MKYIFLAIFMCFFLLINSNPVLNCDACGDDHCLCATEGFCTCLHLKSGEAKKPTL